MCLLACPLVGAQPNIAQDHVPMDGTAHNGPVLSPTSVSNQANVLTVLSTDWPHSGNSSVAILSS